MARLLLSVEELSSPGLKNLFQINSLPHNPDLTPHEKKAFESIVEKDLFLFQKCFLPFQTEISIFESQLLCRLQIL